MKLQFLRFGDELYTAGYSQKQQAKLMFERYPEIPQAYDLLMKLTDIFNHCKCREEVF